MDRPTGHYTHERLIALEDSHKSLIDLVGLLLDIIKEDELLITQACCFSDKKMGRKLREQHMDTFQTMLSRKFDETKVMLGIPAVEQAKKIRKEAGL